MEFEEIEIRKRIEEAKKMKYCAKQQMAQADIQIGEYDLELLRLNEEKEEQISDEKPKTIRKYGVSRIERIPILIDVRPDGKLISKKGQVARAYDIFVLLDLRNKIPQTRKYPSMKGLSRTTIVSETTCTKLCAGIELGMYDDIFAKWENMNIKFKDGQLV